MQFFFIIFFVRAFISFLFCHDFFFFQFRLDDHNSNDHFVFIMSRFFCFFFSISFRRSQFERLFRFYFVTIFFFNFFFFFLRCDHFIFILSWFFFSIFFFSISRKRLQFKRLFYFYLIMIFFFTILSYRFFLLWFFFCYFQSLFYRVYHFSIKSIDNFFFQFRILRKIFTNFQHRYHNNKKMMFVVCYISHINIDFKLIN